MDFSFRALVAHPGLQHSHQLAWALEEQGCLGAFWSGIPVRGLRDSGGLATWVMQKRLREAEIPANKMGHNLLFPFARRLSSVLGSQRSNIAIQHYLDRAYDRWVARKVRADRFDLVVCYENAALETFREAKDLGAVCVLDAASVHFSAGREWAADSSGPRWIDERKAKEIELADAVMTCSDFAAETYRAAGVPTAKLFPVPLGADLTGQPQRRAHNQNLECRFVFVGTLRRLKGVDILLDVFEARAKEGRVDATLTLIGGVVETDLLERARKIPNVRHHRYIPHPKLFNEIAQHDVLVLPSRLDSFGMTVPEAMAVGLPALVSDRVGAKCVIEKHPGAGWIVPCEVGAMRQQIAKLVGQRQLIGDASIAAIRAARDYSWQNYRAKAGATLADVYRRCRGR